jgi:hypothetical protein
VQEVAETALAGCCAWGGWSIWMATDDESDWLWPRIGRTTATADVAVDVGDCCRFVGCGWFCCSRCGDEGSTAVVVVGISFIGEEEPLIRGIFTTQF